MAQRIDVWGLDVDRSSRLQQAPCLSDFSKWIVKMLNDVVESDSVERGASVGPGFDPPQPHFEPSCPGALNGLGIRIAAKRPPSSIA
jgi:hypothetical protein